MKLVAVIVFSAVAHSACGQAPLPDNPAREPAQYAAPEKSQDEAKRSTLEVKPGSPAIKPKDVWNATGFLHPFVRMPKYILQDQVAIWTSPWRTTRKDLKWWAISGAATAALIATDQYSVKQLPNSSGQVSVSTWASRLGSAYSLVPVSAGFYLIGTARHNDRFRETGLICFEALIDSNLTVEAIKLVAGRARPLESDGRGHFEDSPNGRWHSGFPSGHAINSWAMASVVAHQYPRPRIIPIMAYALASTVVIARVGARRHFPGDVLAGSAMGWFIGDYLYGKRHNRGLDRRASAAQKILDHIRIGGLTP